MTWHVANVTNLIISIEPLTGANIEVRHAKKESSMNMDRCGTQTSVILHKFAKVPWLKLRRNKSVMDGDLKIAAVNTTPMAIEEIGSNEERQTRLIRKDTLEVPQTRGSEGSDARRSRDPVAHPVETSIAQRTAPDLVLWSDEPGRFLEPAQEERKARGKAAHELTHTSFRNWCSNCVRARAADDPHHRQPHKEPEFPIIMADYCFTQDAPGSEPVHDPGHVRCCSRHDGSNQCGGKGPATFVVSAVVEHLRAWGRKKVIFRIDGEPAIRALGVAIQHARSEETVIECRPKYSSPSMGPVENMNKELCGRVRCFRIYLREQAKLVIKTESPLLP